VLATAFIAAGFYYWAVTNAPMPEGYDRIPVRIIGLQALVLVLTAGVVSVASGLRQAEKEMMLLAEARLEDARRRVLMAQYVDNLIRPQKLPAAPGLDIGVRFRPAGAGISGDYYDVFPLGERRWGFVVGDVRSKEEMALAYLPIFKSSLRLNARAERSPATVLTAMNREVTQDMEERGDLEGFISMCYAVIDLDKGTLTYANAGMEAGALALAQSDHILNLSAQGIVLGIEREVKYEEESWAIHQGDVLVLFSDGLTEAMNRQGKMLSREGLIVQWKAALTERTADAVAHRTFTHVMEEYGMGARRRDDSTLLVVRITASDVGPQPEPSAV
jgi:sigma-B regulation protein RsbU (phosphoserine phosphatase)